MRDFVLHIHLPTPLGGTTATRKECVGIRFTHDQWRRPWLTAGGRGKGTARQHMAHADYEEHCATKAFKAWGLTEE